MTLEADPLRESILLAQARRQERQADKLRLQRERQRPTYAAASGQVKPLGADGPIRLRGSLLAGGVAVGAPVAMSQGLAMSQPAIGQGLGFDPSAIEEAIRQLRQLIGVQIKDVDPVNAADARYLGDTWLNTVSQALFVWVGPPTGWIQTSGGGGASIQYGAGDPNADSITPIGFYFDTDAQRMFVPNKSDPNAAGIAWVPTGSKVFIEGEAANTTTYYEGDIWGRRFGNNICIDIYDGGNWEDTSTGCPGSAGPSSGGGSS